MILVLSPALVAVQALVRVFVLAPAPAPFRVLLFLGAPGLGCPCFFVAASAPLVSPHSGLLFSMLHLPVMS